MKKNLYISTSIVIILLLTIIIFSYPKKIISRVIFAHELSLLPNIVFTKINKTIEFDMEDSKNKENSLIVLNNYVYDFVKYNKYMGNIDDSVSWKLLHGSILCDGVSDIFLRLAEHTNTRVIMTALFQNNGSSPHTIVMADLKNKILNFNNQKNLEKMYIFDPSHNYLPLNNQKDYITLEYMTKNKGQFLNYKYLNSDSINLNLIINEKRIMLTNRLLSEYNFVNKFAKNISNIIPEYFLKKILRFGININPDLENNYKLLLNARLEHVLLNYKEAIKRYKMIKPNSGSSNKYYNNAQFWIERIKNSQSKLKDIDQII